VLRYTVVTPARDEATDLPRLARSLARQSCLPERWVIVDDGSTDSTRAVAEDLARRYGWIRVVSRPGEPVATRGGAVVRAFRDGVRAADPSAEVVVKLDADVSLAADHFERLLAEFEADGRLGIASGSRYERARGRWRRQSVTGTSVEGQCRAYRRSCLGDVSPLEERVGWDGVDEIRANVLGWRTAVFRELPFRHHRAIGERDRSRLRAWVAQGEANYYMRYRWYYALARALFRARRDPRALGLAWGYARAAALGGQRCDAPGVAAYVRRQQRWTNIPSRVQEALGRRP
jgi:poly-beta-1,6-N-acetyl-D-glucosamine synthase